MTKLIKKLAFKPALIITILIALLSTACFNRGGDRDPLVGRWIQDNGRLTYEFFEDGSMVAIFGDHPPVYGRWSRLNEDLLMYLDGMMDLSSYHVDGDTLRIGLRGGRVHVPGLPYMSFQRSR